jgi:hypothetical protein
MASSENQIAPTTFVSQIKMIGILLLGALILGIHVVLFLWNSYAFNIFVCLYIVTFSVLVTVFIYQNKNCFIDKPVKFNILTYLSVYTIVLQFIILIISVVFLMNPRR